MGASVSAQTNRRMANAGQIPALRTGKDYRYSWNAVLDVLRQPHPIAGGSENDESRPEPGGWRPSRLGTEPRGSCDTGRSR